MSDASKPRKTQRPPEGGAFEAVAAVLYQNLAMHHFVLRPDLRGPASPAQRMEAASKSFQEDMKAVGWIAESFLRRLMMVEENRWNLSVREAMAEVARDLLRDLNEVFRVAYPATLLGVLKVLPEPLDRVGPPLTVRNVLDTYYDRFMDIDDAWREANPCLRRHRQEDDETQTPS